ncbi:MAG: hypothetical protein EBY23_06410 [Actinobacteria bacterium]|nr:hypothetical protein [Actinomycetota bacterium]
MRSGGSKCETLCDMRRSIDDYPMTSSDVPAGDDDAMRIAWAVAICDDYDDAEPRVVLTTEEVGSPGTGLVAPPVCSFSCLFGRRYCP